jgi:hypothetical protein
MSGVYRSHLAGLPCTDVSKDDPVFLAFLDNIDAAAQSWPADWKGESSNVK